MSSMLYAFGHWVVRARWAVLVAWALLIALVAGGALLLDKGTSNSFSIPGTESQTALDQLSATFPQTAGASAQLVVVSAPGTTISSPDYRTAIAKAVADLEKQPEVDSVASPFAKSGGAVSSDGRSGIITIQMTEAETSVSSTAETDLQAAAARLQKALPPGSESALGGSLFSTSVPGQSAVDAVGLLVAVVVLLVTFGSFAAAGLPLLSALVGVGVSIAGIYASTAFASVSSTTPLLAIMLGLAVGIDYALFIISRHLDQRRHGMPVADSIAKSVATSGSAVIFAGLTVIIALCGLSVANIPFLSVMGIAAAAAVAIAVVASLTLVPALLAIAGEKLGAPSKRRAKREASSTVAVNAPAPVSSSTPHPNRFFLGWIKTVTRWPIVTVAIVVIGLGSLAIPATHLQLDLTNAEQLPTSNPARTAYDLVADHFGAGYNGPLIVTGSIVTSSNPVGTMNEIAAELRKLPDVASVPLATPNASADTGIIQVIPKSGPSSPETSALVNQIRSERAHFQDKYGVTLSVTGFTAVGIDISSRLGSSLLPFGALVVGLSLILLAMVFRSIAVPIKATIGYLFSVIAALGVVSAVFGEGVFAKPLGVDSTGPVISFLPIILMGVLFGLAMDYEVFLVSRMREEYVHRGDAQAAIRNGFLGSAKVVTAAAIIMFSVFAAFFPTGDSTIKPMALGLAVGVFTDAFIVRMSFVPAVLTLLGDHAWWLPKWLDRILPSFDVEGEGLERELSLANWPEPGCTAAVVGEDVTVGRPDAPALAGLSLRTEPGETAMPKVRDAAEARALALAVSGRARPESGTLKVLGYALPERAGAVRRHSVYLDLTTPKPRDVEWCDHFASVKNRGIDLVAIDGIDQLASPEAVSALRQALGEASANAREAGRSLTVIAPTTRTRVEALA